MHRGLDDQAAGRRATLAGRKERALDGAVQRQLHVGIGQHDQRILAAHFQLHLGAACAGGAQNLLAHALRAGEADGVHQWAVDHRLTHLAPAADHKVEHAGRQLRAADDGGQRGATGRHQLGRLEHHGVAIGQRGRNLPGGNGKREIPRRDQADHADRFTGDIHLHTGAHRSQGLTLYAQGLTGKEFEDLAGTGHFAHAFGQGLALFARQQLTQLVLARQQLAADLVQRVETALRCAKAPLGQGVGRSPDGFLYLGTVGAGIFRDDVACVRRVLATAHGDTVDPTSVDVVPDRLGALTHAVLTLDLDGSAV